MTDADESVFDPTVFGVVLALDDHRVEDAVMLVDALIEEKGPQDAVLDVAYVAMLLHASSPAMPLRLISAMTRAELDGGSITGADIGQEFLEVLAQLLDSGPELSDDSQAILDRYQLRPGSPEPITVIAKCMAAVIGHLRFQLELPSPGLRDPDTVNEIVARSMRQMWDELERNRPTADGP